MNEEEKQAIDTLQNCIADYVIGDFCVGKYCPQEDVCKNDDCPFEKAIDTVLNLIEKQNKVIDKMAEQYKKDAKFNPSMPYGATKEQLIEYFYKEIE